MASCKIVAKGRLKISSPPFLFYDPSISPKLIELESGNFKLDKDICTKFHGKWITAMQR